MYTTHNTVNHQMLGQSGLSPPKQSLCIDNLSQLIINYRGAVIGILLEEAKLEK